MESGLYWIGGSSSGTVQVYLSIILYSLQSAFYCIYIVNNVPLRHSRAILA